MGLGAGDHNLGIGDDLLAARAQDDAVELCDAQRGAGEEVEEGRALMRASEVAREAGRGMPSVRGENTVAAAGGANGANGGRGGEAS